jgi:hypothetical protein
MPFASRVEIIVTQVPNAKVALQHNLGLGGAAVVTMYKKASFQLPAKRVGSDVSSVGSAPSATPAAPRPTAPFAPAAAPVAAKAAKAAKGADAAPKASGAAAGMWANGPRIASFLCCTRVPVFML